MPTPQLVNFMEESVIFRDFSECILRHPGEFISTILHPFLQYQQNSTGSIHKRHMNHRNFHFSEAPTIYPEDYV